MSVHGFNLHSDPAPSVFFVQNIFGLTSLLFVGGAQNKSEHASGTNHNISKHIGSYDFHKQENLSGCFQCGFVSSLPFK
jgi:hypothetical protein